MNNELTRFDGIMTMSEQAQPTPCPSIIPEAFPLPRPSTDCGCAVLIILFFGYFMFLALQNLANGEGLIASVIYLLLIGGFLWQAWQEHGARGMLIHFLGVFVWNHFVWRTDPGAGTRPPSNPSSLASAQDRLSTVPDRYSGSVPGPMTAGTVQDLHFGYELWGRRLHYLEISAGHVESVYWGPGQGTAMAGRDMNDWSVVMWYDDIPGCRKVNPSFKPGLEIYIVGPTRHREATEILGLAFIEFLHAAGATLIETREKDRLLYARGPGKTGQGHK
jgi:hypothetical protein